MNDLDQWAKEDGPEPPWLRKLFDAGREVPETSPEEAEEMERAFLKALAEEGRTHARDRKVKRWSAGLGVAAALVLVVIAGPEVLRALRRPVFDHRNAKGDGMPTDVATSADTSEPAGPDAGADAGASGPPGGAPRPRR